MAAVESITVGDLVSDVRFILTNSSAADSDLDTQIKVWLNATMRDMIARSEHPSFTMEDVMKLSAGTQDYDLPGDYGRMIEPGVRHFREGDSMLTVKYITQPTYDEHEGARWWTDTGIPTHYTFTGREKETQGTFKVRFFPIPDEPYQIKYSYYGIPENIRAAADSVEIDRRFPRELVHVLVTGTCLYFPKYLAGHLATYKEKYAEALASLQRNSRPLVGGYQQSRRMDGISSLGGSVLVRGSIDISDQDNHF